MEEHKEINTQTLLNAYMHTHERKMRKKTIREASKE
jgi:hypothetical protein